MRRVSSGFTLVEVLICIGLLAILIVPFMTMVDNSLASYHRSLREVGVRTEMDRTGYRLQSLLRTHPGFQISSDNRGATWTGGQIRWSDGSVLTTDAQGTRTLATGVSHFSIHRRDGLTYLTLEFQDQQSGKKHRKSVLVEEDTRAKGL
jgi:prepilin-type N-terminal cleavage/methylation domain-containing protein